LAIGGAYAGDATRLPIGLPEHVTDVRHLFHDSLVHPIGLEALAMTARTQEPLREKSRSALHATPDTNAWSHATPTMILVSRASEA
jgi:hypothetical protein